MEKKHCVACGSLEHVQEYRLSNPNTHKLTGCVCICSLCRQYFIGLIGTVERKGDDTDEN